MSEEQKRLLEKQLWGVANVLRGKMNADEYKNYILGFIFYKYLSEKLERYVDEKLLSREDYKFADIKENTKEGKAILDEIKKAVISHLGFFLKPSELFSCIVKNGNGEAKGEKAFILEDLKNILNSIEQTSMGTASEDDFKGLFDDVDLTSSKLGSSEKKKNDVIVEVLTLLKGIDFKLEDSKSDLLGDAYEYLIGEFAAGAGKKGGEFYTPAQVSRLLAQIVSVDKKRVRSVFDPTCGSGSLLLRLKDYTEVSDYYGQELNPTTYNLARMNMILHGVHFDHFKIRRGDTLTEDLHPDLKAEAVIANPPFAAEWKGDHDPQLTHDDRFSQYGRLAPKSNADYAFVTHMLYHLADNGIMAVVLPHGALFHSGAEGQIRQYIIEKQNYLDAVIGLPGNLFYGAGISVTVLVFKKCRKDDEDILFIDASKEFEKKGNQNYLTDENITKIFDTYKFRREVEKYSHRASLKEVKEKKYNLNITKYVDTFEFEKMIDIGRASNTLSQLAEIEKKIILKISKYCEELKVPKPTGYNLYFLKEYKKSIMHKIFSQEVRFKDSKGNLFSDWEDKILQDVVSRFATGLNPRNNFKLGKGDNYYVTIKNITNGRLYLDSCEKIDNDALKKIKNRSGLMVGDIIFSSIGNIGESYLVEEEPKNWNINESVFLLRALKSKIIPKFLYYIITNQDTKKYFTNNITGSTFKSIKIGDLRLTPLRLPCIQEQQKISEYLLLIDKLIESIEQEIAFVEKWEKNLMLGLSV